MKTYEIPALNRDLTPKEIETIKLIAEDISDAEIAVRMHVTRQTAKRHGYNARNKIGCDSRVGLAMYAVRKGLVTP